MVKCRWYQGLPLFSVKVEAAASEGQIAEKPSKGKGIPGRVLPKKSKQFSLRAEKRI